MASFMIITAIFLIVVSVMILTSLNGLLKAVQAIQSRIEAIADSKLSVLAVTDARRLNSTTVVANVTVVYGSMIPKLTLCDVMVTYVDSATNKSVTYHLDYGKIPGWAVLKVISGNATYSITSHDYLLPGEKVEVAAYLPTSSSLNYSVIFVFSSPNGATATYAVG